MDQQQFKSEYSSLPTSDLRKAMRDLDIVKRGTPERTDHVNWSRDQLVAFCEKFFDGGTTETPKPQHTKQLGLGLGTISLDLSGIESYVQGALANLRAELSQLKSVQPQIKEIHLPELQPVRIEESTHELFEIALRIVSADVPLWLAGPAGCGKSHLASQIAKALQLDFYALSHCDETTKGELLGILNALNQEQYTASPFRNAFEHGGIYLADEIDSAPAGLITVLNSAVANGFCRFPDGKTIERHKDFRLIAGANTFGTGADSVYTGRTRLDAATLDRFAFLAMGYDKNLELTLLGLAGKESKVDSYAGGFITNHDWAELCFKCRANAEMNSMKVLIGGTRALVNGKKLIDAGLGKDWIVSSLLAKGLSKEDQKRVGL